MTFIIAYVCRKETRILAQLLNKGISWGLLPAYAGHFPPFGVEVLCEVDAYAGLEQGYSVSELFSTLYLIGLAPMEEDGLTVAPVTIATLF